VGHQASVKVLQGVTIFCQKERCHQIVVMGDGSTVRFIWRGTSWSVERKYLARVISD
jgi:hypothetical protein